MKVPSASPSESSFVLVYGDDDLEVRQKASSLVTQWRGEFPGVEPDLVDGRVGTVKEMMDSLNQVGLALESFSLFGNGRIVWLRDCSFVGTEGRLAQSGETGRRLDELLEGLGKCDCSQTRFLVSCAGVDKRKRFYKWFQKHGMLIGCESLAARGDEGERIACDLVQSRVSESGKTMRRELVDQLIQWVGLDRRALLVECEKAMLHSGDSSEVTMADLEATVTKTRQAKAFAFADAVAERKLEEALRRLDDELWAMRTDRQKSEIGLLYGLISKFRTLLLVKDLVVTGQLRAESSYARFRSQVSSLSKDAFPGDRRYNPLSQNPYVLFRAAGQSGNYRIDELVAALDRLMACNVRMVSAGDRSGSVLREGVIDIILGGRDRMVETQSKQ